MSKFISTALKLWKGLDKGHSQELLPGGANVPGSGRPETPPGVIMRSFPQKILHFYC